MTLFPRSAMRIITASGVGTSEGVCACVCVCVCVWRGQVYDECMASTPRIGPILTAPASREPTGRQG